ncbi:MAG TPA: hypothetical protein VLR94_12105 [Acidobacteriota bacterium]|nr:hypothetical protein [Acidobacteriota bacterium]
MTINRLRVFHLNQRKPDPDGRYVLYWLQIQRRLESNFALDYAVEWANKLDRPLLLFEALQCDYPWANLRMHSFLLQGMRENQAVCAGMGRPYFAYVEQHPGQGRGLLRALSEDACLVVTDAFPAFVIRDHNEHLAPLLDVAFTAVDSNGIIPLGSSAKAPYSAYEFRRLMQKSFVEAYSHPPKKSALRGVKNLSPVNLDGIQRRWPVARLEEGAPVTDGVSLDRSVPAAEMQGTRKAALERLKQFVANDLLDYAQLHNHPDLQKTSGLSPYLHFGKISAHEVVAEVLGRQPKGWTIDAVAYNRGSREGFFKGHPSIEAFLDQLITWRETGYHYCHHVRNFDRYESLPDWARRTLDKHAADQRQFVYTREQFEHAQTHDPLWNAAQNQLRREGVLHNYLRMLWGKKILEWSPEPRTALSTMIELNNKYALDGRDPNSYTGIFWTLGRFDRPWAPEREIFGSVRTMSSENTARKVKVKEYLRRYA